MDLVIRLREFRRMCRLTQRKAAELSGIGVKSISSFETGRRTDSLKISQLVRLLEVYGVTSEDFFGVPVDENDAWTDTALLHRRGHLMRRLRELPDTMQETLMARLSVMIETAEELQAAVQPRPYANEHVEWQMLTSHN